MANTTPSSPLRTLLDGAPRYAMVCHKTAAGATQAIITTTGSGYWARLFGGGPSVEGNRLRDDVAGLVALLAQAGIPVEGGWEQWQATAR